MKKMMLVIVLAVSVTLAYGQTAAGTFEINIKRPLQGLTQASISNYISKVNFENYRLKDKPTTLVFDNGFEIMLYSAADMQYKNRITDISKYQSAFSDLFVLPVFHMTSDGKIGAEYPVINSKFSTQNH